jgi:uncharacterized membrane protein
VSFDDWMLALHVLGAFVLVGGVILFWALIVAVRQVDTPDEVIRMAAPVKVAEIAIGVGAFGTIGPGLWLAFSVGDYDLWDGWIVAGIVLWAVAMGLGQRTNAAYVPAVRKAEELKAAGQTGPNAELLALNRTSTGLLMQTLVSVAVVLVLVDMIWKPGA